MLRIFFGKQEKKVDYSHILLLGMDVDMLWHIIGVRRIEVLFFIMS